MTSLASRASFKLGIPKRTWSLVTHYLRLFVRYGWVRIFYLEEKDGQLVYWLRNAKCYFTLRIGLGSDVVELTQIYFSMRWERNVSDRLVIGPGGRRRTYIKMLRKLMWQGGCDSYLTASPGDVV